MNIDRKEVIRFSQIIPAGTTQIFSERVKRDATIEKIVMKFYPGQVLKLEVRPVLEKKGSEILQDLLTYPEGTRRFVAGDDDPFTFDIVIPAENDDNIKVLVTNTADFDCNISCDITVDYYGGKQRVV